MKENIVKAIYNFLNSKGVYQNYVEFDPSTYDDYFNCIPLITPNNQELYVTSVRPIVSNVHIALEVGVVSNEECNDFEVVEYLIEDLDCEDIYQICCEAYYYVCDADDEDWDDYLEHWNKK